MCSPCNHLPLLGFLLVILCVVPLVDAISYTGCPSSPLTDVDFANSTFTLSDNCSLRIEGGSAFELFFTGHIGLVLDIRNLVCTNNHAPGACVNLNGTLTAGSVFVQGISQTINGTIAAGGDFYCVRIGGAVAGTDISITHAQLTLNAAVTTGNANFYVVRADAPLAGRNVSGSSLDVSYARVSGAAVTNGGALVVLVAFYAWPLSGYASVTSSHNDLSGVSLTASAYMFVIVLNLLQQVTLTGTASSIIAVRNNSALNLWMAAAGYAQLVLINMPTAGTRLISGVASVVAEGWDARNVTVTSQSSYSRLMAVLFRSNIGLQMVANGDISIDNVWISGTLKYATSDPYCGAAVLVAQQLNGVGTIAVRSTYIDMNGSGGGMVVTGASTDAVATVLRLRSPVNVATAITCTNCSLRGKYSCMSDSQVQLNVLLAEATFAVPTLTINASSGVYTPRPVIQQGPMSFRGAVTNTNIIVRGLACGDVRSQDSSCVYFGSTISGGSLLIDGAARTLTGSAGTATAGTYALVLLAAAVASTDVSILNCAIALTDVASTVSTAVSILKGLAGPIAGKGAAESTFNMSNNKIIGALNASGGIVLSICDPASSLLQYEFIELSGNEISVSARALGIFAQCYIFSTSAAVTLIGTPASTIALRRNVIAPAMLVSNSGAASVVLSSWHATSAVSGAASILIDGLSMGGGANIRAATWARVAALYFASPISLVHAGVISVKNVRIAGAMSYAASNNHGVRVADFASLSGVQTLSISDSVIDMSGGLNATSSAANAAAAILRFKSGSICNVAVALSVNGCAVRGVFASNGTADLRIVQADTALGVGHVNISDNAIDASAVTAQDAITMYISEFTGVLSSLGPTTTPFVARDNVIAGSYRSATSSVCAALAIGSSNESTSISFVAPVELHTNFVATNGSSVLGASPAWSRLFTCGAAETTTTTTTTTTTRVTTSTTSTSPSSTATETSTTITADLTTSAEATATTSLPATTTAATTAAAETSTTAVHVQTTTSATSTSISTTSTEASSEPSTTAPETTTTSAVAPPTSTTTAAATTTATISAAPAQPTTTTVPAIVTTSSSAASSASAVAATTASGGGAVGETTTSEMTTTITATENATAGVPVPFPSRRPATPPPPVATTTDPSGQASSADAPNSNGGGGSACSSDKLGACLGAIFGALGGIILLGLIIYLIARRRQQQRAGPRLATDSMQDPARFTTNFHANFGQGDAEEMELAAGMAAIETNNVAPMSFASTVFESPDSACVLHQELQQQQPSPAGGVVFDFEL